MWCQMRGRRFQVVAGLLLAPAMMAGLALTAGPAHAQYPVSGGARNGSAVLTRALDSTRATKPRIKISRGTGTPGSSMTVSGAGFGAHQAVDLYFDRSDKALVSTNGRGAFFGRALRVPGSAAPGTHYVTAVQRHTARSAQAKFLVNTNWVQDGFSASHYGFNPYENVLSPSNVGGLQLEWTGHLARFQKTDIAPSPAVVNGVVYMSSTRSQDRPSRVYAFSAATGKKLWSFRGGSSNIGGAPAVVNGTVYTNVGSDPGTDSVYALSADTGKVKWSFAAGGDVEWSPTVVNGTVYFGSDSGYVFALTASGATYRWNRNIGSAVTSAPTVVGGVVYVGSSSGTVYALSAAIGGRILWSHSTGAAISYSDVVVASGTVYVANSAGEVYALGVAHGHELWSFDAGAGIASPIAVANGVIYINTSGPDGAVEAVSAATGQLLWTFASGGSSSAAPTVANGVVYVGSSDDDVYALDAATGAELWSFRTGLYVESSPAVVNGRVYVGSDDGRIYAFGLPVGQRAEARPRPSSLKPNYSLQEQ
jgi:eukaryotic-like serine/threonine-protein kinase